MDALFKGANEQDQLSKVISILGTPPMSWEGGYKLAKKIGVQFGQYTRVPLENIIKSASPDAIDLLNQMLQYDPAKRPSASQILTHPYFSKSMSSEGRAPMWGEQSVRENYAKKKSLVNAKYENPLNSVINMQNNYASKPNLKDFDNDWDDEFDIVVKPKGLEGASGANRSVVRLNNHAETSMVDANKGAGINNSGVFLQNSALNMKNDARGGPLKAGWEDGKLDQSLEEDFDVFNVGQKKPAVKVNNFGNKIFDDKKANNGFTDKKKFDIGWEDGDEF